MSHKRSYYQQTFFLIFVYIRCIVGAHTRQRRNHWLFECHFVLVYFFLANFHYFSDTDIA